MAFTPDAGRLVDAVIPARNYTPANRVPRKVVIHTMENDEKPTGAENVARWFAGPTAPRASAHYCIDNDTIVQGVRERDVAWAAPGANHDGVQLEHAGRARQTRGEWFDTYSRAMLERSARLTADICRRHGIPPVWLDVAAVKAGGSGITSHANVSLAFGRSTHTDPGNGFPDDWYVARVRELLAPPTYRAPWVARNKAGAVIGAGSLSHPAFIRRITGELRRVGEAAPWEASVDGTVFATGRFWPLGPFKAAVSKALIAGHTVTFNQEVTINPKEKP